VSYYTKGSLVGLCFDLTLRNEGKGSLDDVMRWLFTHSKANKPGKGGITAADVAQALQAVGGRSYAQEIADWVHGTLELPLVNLLQAHGVNITPEPATSLPMAQRLGLRVSESGGALVVKTVLRGGLAEAAGFAAGDEWIAAGDWRIHKLDDLALLAGTAKQVTATISRDKRMLRLKLVMPQASQAPSSFMLRTGKDEPLTQWLLG
jgi:predicted metalloprotease with PDZ domain